MKRIISPQEKKIHSYVRDGRNMYGESRTSAIKSIGQRKSIVNRHFRRTITTQIRAAKDCIDANEVTEAVQAVARKQWRKVPDRPLVEYVESNLKRRSYTNVHQPAGANTLVQEAKKRLCKRRASR